MAWSQTWRQSYLLPERYCENLAAVEGAIGSLDWDSTPSFGEPSGKASDYKPVILVVGRLAEECEKEIIDLLLVVVARPGGTTISGLGNCRRIVKHEASVVVLEERACYPYSTCGVELYPFFTRIRLYLSEPQI